MERSPKKSWLRACSSVRFSQRWKSVYPCKILQFKYWIQQMVLKAICFLLNSLLANMAAILIIFQQKFALIKVFNTLPLNLWPKKISHTLEECFKIFIKLARKIWRFLLEFRSRKWPKLLCDREWRYPARTGKASDDHAKITFCL